MELGLEGPMGWGGVETAGIDIGKDGVVEICLIKLEPNGNRERKSRRINPEMHIPETSSAVHGIYDEDVKDCPTFKQVAEGLKETLQGSDLAGFNSNKFDIPLLAEEFIRAGVMIDLNTPLRVDDQNIYHK